MTTRTLAANGGEENHVLASGELAAHSHTISDPGHGHSIAISGDIYNDNAGVTVGPGYGVETATPGFGLSRTLGLGAAYTGIMGTANAGSGTGHNNLQPYAVARHIIKIL